MSTLHSLSAGMHSDVTPVVLAGGRSERMGRSKAWLPWHGVPLLVHVLRQLGEDAVVVAAAEQSLPPLPGATRVVRDLRPGEGPLHGLARGLAQVHSEWAFVATTDAPFVRRELAARLRALTTTSSDAVVATVLGRPQPLMALYRPELAAVADALVEGGERRARALAEHARTRRVTEDELAQPPLAEVDPQLRCFLTVNTEAEYEEALSLSRGAS